MLRTVFTYTRSGEEDRQSVLRCYLPLAAGHNLALAGQLMALEISRREVPLASTSGGQEPASVEEKLAIVTSLHFDRETLESALAQLAADVDLSIELAGSDLELSGITKNQSFSLDLRNRPAREILVEILRAANPDKSATGPADERQNLVFTVRRSEAGGPDVLIVTTRSAARARGDRIASPFDLNE